MAHHIFYIHGLGSSPHSAKGKVFAHIATEHGYRFHAPDFNLPQFAELTLTRVLEQSELALAEIPASDTVTLVGSSFGGLAAATLAARCSRGDARWSATIAGIVLLAPALYCHNFPAYAAVLPQWERSGSYLVWHTQQNRELPLHWGFIADMRGHSEAPAITPHIPVLVLHGENDTVVPISGSERWVAEHPQAKFLRMNTDHGMLDQLAEIQKVAAEFIEAQVGSASR